MNSKSFGWYRVLYIILAVLYIFAGIMLIANPSAFAPMMIYLVGWMAVFYGIIMIASYFMATHFKTIWTLLLGFVLIVLGFLMMSNLFATSVALGVMAGIGFMLAGGYKIYQSFMVKELGVSSWWAILLLGICNLIIGFILICNLGSAATLLTILIGTNLLVNGVSDLMLGFVAF